MPLVDLNIHPVAAGTAWLLDYDADDHRSSRRSAALLTRSTSVTLLGGLTAPLTTMTNLVLLHDPCQCSYSMCTLTNMRTNSWTRNYPSGYQHPLKQKPLSQFSSSLVVARKLAKHQCRYYLSHCQAKTWPVKSSEVAAILQVGILTVRHVGTTSGHNEPIS